MNEKRMSLGEQLLRWAVVASVLFHLSLLGGYELGKRYKWWQKSLLPHWLKSTPLVISELKKKQSAKPQQQQEAPLLFVDVDPAAATAEAPKNAKYYSSKNSQAANQEAKADTDTPKIDGSQALVPKTENVPRAKPVPLQPSPPKPEPEQPVAKEEAQPDPKPKGGPPVGDLALAKPMDKPGENQAEETPKAVHKRPNTIVEAKMRNEIAGQKMKQLGGVRRLTLDSLDTRATTYGEYDRELINAIQSHWYDLLDRKDFSRDRAGKVVLEFDLGADGRVTNLHVIENDVDELLCYVCQRAVLDPTPFAPWPSDMRREIAADKREVRFTFFYE